MPCESALNNHLYDHLVSLVIPDHQGNEPSILETVTSNLEAIRNFSPQIDLNISKTATLYYDSAKFTISLGDNEKDERISTVAVNIIYPTPEVTLSNIKGLFLFMCENVNKVATLKIQETGKSLAQYYSEIANDVDKGISRLANRIGLQSEEEVKENPGTAGNDLFPEINECFTVKSPLLYGLQLAEVVNQQPNPKVVVGYKDDKFTVFPLLDAIMEISSHHLWTANTPFSSRFIHAVFGKQTTEFVDACLRIDEKDREKVLAEVFDLLMGIFKKNNRNSDFDVQQSPECDALNLYLLNSVHFKPVHDYLRAIVLSKKENLNSPTKSKLVQKAFESLQETVNGVRSTRRGEQEQVDEIDEYLLKSMFKENHSSIWMWGQVLAEMDQTANLLRSILPRSLGAPRNNLIFNHQFFAKVLVKFDDILAIDITDPQTREKLISCAEDILVVHFSSMLDDDKEQTDLNEWLIKFPEARNNSKIATILEIQHGQMEIKQLRKLSSVRQTQPQPTPSDWAGYSAQVVNPIPQPFYVAGYPQSTYQGPFYPQGFHSRPGNYY